VTDSSEVLSAAGQYLRSVVVLDDRLLLELGQDASGDQSLEGLEEFVSSFAKAGLIAMPAVPTWTSHDDDAEDRFAEVGRLCSRSDVVVLDWDMPAPDGKVVGATAMRLIDFLTKPPSTVLRLIVIYSHFDRDAIEATLDTALGDSTANTWAKGATRVAIVRKQGAPDIDRDEDDPPASIAELPGRLTQLFDFVITGVVPQTVVAALAASRDRAGAVIGRYTATSDLGFLGEALAKASVPDALRQLLDAVGDDAFGGVQRQIEEATYARLDTHLQDCSLLVDEFALDSARAVLRGDAGAPKKFRRKPSHWLKGTKDESATHPSDLSFGALVQTRIVTGDEVAPILQLGTVVKWKGEDRFGVCLMALCDAARSGPSEFPFALFAASDRVDGEMFPLSFGSGHEHSSESGLFEGSMKLQDMTFLHFHAEAKKPVMAERKDSAWVFKEKLTSRLAFEYVCELRPPVAFKLVQLVVSDASRFGRYGLDLPEWIRWSAKGL